MKDSIAFDFDGVLADTDEFKRQWFFNNTGLILKNTSKTNIYKELSNLYPQSEIDIIYKKMSSDVFNEDILSKTKKMDDNLRIYLKLLSEKYNLVIVTKRPSFMLDWIKKWLNVNGLIDYFDKIFSSSNTKKSEILINNNIDILVDDDISNLQDKKIKHNVLFNSAFISDWGHLFSYLSEVNKRKVITFFGLPAAGKSTFMSQLPDYTKVISSQLLIDAGIDVKSGNLINDDDVVKLVLEKIKDIDGNIILDGFPRTDNQLKCLIKEGINIDCVYNVITPYNIILNRVEDRLTCLSCHESYTISNYKRPFRPGLCDICGGQIVKRSDDNFETHRIRVNNFISKTFPLLNSFKNNHIKVVDVDGLNYRLIEKSKNVYIGIIWNTLEKQFDNVLFDLQLLGNVLDSFEVDFDSNLENFIWDVYGREPEIVREHVQRKINYTVNLSSTRKVKIIYIEVEKNPKDIKNYIRKIYKDKVDIYDYDNIFHFTDNEEENVKIINAISNNLSSKEKIFEESNKKNKILKMIK